MQGSFKKHIKIIEVASHMMYIDRTNLSNYLWEIKKNLSTDLILKWEIVKKNAVNGKWGINIVIYVGGEICRSFLQ